MKSIPWSRLSLAFALLAVVGCGGNDVVRIDRTNSDSGASRGGASSTHSNGDSSQGDSRDNRSQPPADSNPTNVEDPTTAVVEMSPNELPTTDMPTTAAPTDPESPVEVPNEPAAAPPPPPSDYRVALPAGGSLDIKQLLETSRTEFETKLAAIAEGNRMLRTFYLKNEQDSQGEDGLQGTPENLDDPSNPAAIESAAVTPQRAFNGSQRQPRRRSGRSGSSRSGGSRSNEESQSKVDPSKPFMYIGRIAATLRGPTAAFYRDGNPMIYTSYNRDSRRDGTFISWDDKGRPVVIDQFAAGRRNGMRVLFRARSDNDPTGCVALVQQWRGDKLSATHLVAEHGGAITIDPADTLPDETREELADALNELEEFDEKLQENEVALRKAITAFHREQIRLAKAMKSALRAQQQAMVQRAQLQILTQLQSGIQSPSAWRQGYRQR